MCSHSVKSVGAALAAATLLLAGCSQEVSETPDAASELGVITSSIVEDATVAANRDGTLKELSSTKNFGSENNLRVQGLGRERAFVQFDRTAILDKVAGKTITEAALEVTVLDVSWIYGQVSAHRLKVTPTELGATWLCADDTIPSNSTQNCTAANTWQMTSGGAYLAASDTKNVSNSATPAGTKIRFNVTADVKAFVAAGGVSTGWVIKAQIEGVPGLVRFRSKENTSAPRLILDLACTPSASTDTTCNNVDDDCNGQKDEDFVSSATSCGVGACAAVGSTTCTAGVIASSCTPRAPAANDASCNDIDDDCNGQKDEDFVGAAVQCGSGGCVGEGQSVCVAGVLGSNCVPVANCEGTCDDDADDDGDAQTDCADSDCEGQEACNGAIGDSCESADDCQAYENPFCFAEANSGLAGGLCTRQCTTDAQCPAGSACEQGFCYIPCAQQPCPAGLSCYFELGVDACVPLCDSNDDCAEGRFCNVQRFCQGASDTDETCDGNDDDLDGNIDEEFQSYTSNCGRGPDCLAQGVATCVDGQLVDSCQVPCELECGDGIDDDLDGITDCNDLECSGDPLCLEGAGDSIGVSCTDDAGCTGLGNAGFCATTLPGGYCLMNCAGTGPNGGCPSGTMCLEGTVCVLPCNGQGACDRPNMVCQDLASQGAPPTPFCRPTCALSCPSDMVCDPEQSYCNPA